MEVKPGYKKTDVGVIPVEWEVNPLKGKIGIAHGFAFASEHFASHGPYRLTTPGHFHEAGGFRDIGEKQKYYVGPVPSDYVLEPGDLIVAMTEQADGLLGSAALIPKEHEYLHNQRLGRVKALSSDIKLEYLFYVFNSPGYRAKVRETAAGTKVKHTSPEKLLEIPVRLPPIPEQRAIAEALSDVDALRGVLDRLIAKNRDLKQAAMQQLLTGQTRLPGFHGEWEVKRLGEIAVLNRLNVIPASQPTQMFVHFSLPAFDDRKSPVIEPGADIGSNKFRVPQEAVLVSKLNPRIPRVWAPADIPADAIASTEFLVLTPKVGTSRRLLFVLCSSPLFCDQMELAATGTTGSHQRISPAGALDLTLSVPLDTEEQIAIAEVLSDMDAELAALEQRREKTLALKQAMMQELLTGRTRLV